MSLRQKVTRGLKNPQDLSHVLSELFGQPSRGGQRVPNNVDVVNRKLCDDTISYLAPTLEAYKGCTIIDFHPGSCVWSASLHEYLQPKEHLLMEPEQKYFKPFIKPLLEQSNSTYRHTPLTGAHPRSYWSNYKQILEDHRLLEPRPALPASDPRLRQMDTSILVTGNIARRYKNVIRPSGSIAFTPLILQHFTWAALTNKLFHQAGLVRMLLWVPDDIKDNVNTPLITGRTSFNLGLSIGADLTEIAGAQQNYEAYLERKGGIFRRPPQLVKAGDLAVNKRMKQDNIKVPPLCRALKFPLDKSAKADYKNFLEIHDESLEEFQKACDDFDVRMEGIMETYALVGQPNAAKIMKPKVVNEYLPTIEYPQSLEIRLPAYPSVKSWKLVLDVDLLCRLINLEARLCALHDKGVAVASLKERLISNNERLRDYISNFRIQAIGWIDELLDEQQAYFADPQVIPWDRRRLDALQVQETDFSPRYPLALLDLTPVIRPSLAVPGLASHEEVVRMCQLLVKFLYRHRVQQLAHVLDHIAVNAAKDLIPMIPGISDPRKGGRLDPTKVRVRMLTEDMMIGLARAWFEWPFRPTLWQLQKATESFTNTDEDVAITPEAVTAENED